MRVIHSLSVALTTMSALMIGGCANNYKEYMNDRTKGYNTHDMDLQKKIYLNEYKDINSEWLIPYKLRKCGFADERKIDDNEKHCRDDYYKDILTASDHAQMIPFVKMLRDKCVAECDKNPNSYHSKLSNYDEYIVEAFFINERYQEMLDYFNNINNNETNLYLALFRDTRPSLLEKLIESARKVGGTEFAETYSKGICVKYAPIVNANDHLKISELCKILDSDPKHKVFIEKIANPIKTWRIDNNCATYTTIKNYIEAEKCFKKQAFLYENAIKALPKLGLHEYSHYLTHQKNLSEESASSVIESVKGEQAAAVMQQAEQQLRIERANRQAEQAIRDQESIEAARQIGTAIGIMLSR